MQRANTPHGSRHDVQGGQTLGTLTSEGVHIDLRDMQGESEGLQRDGIWALQSNVTEPDYFNRTMTTSQICK